MSSLNTPENHKLFTERIEALFDAVIEQNKFENINIVMHFSLSMVVKKPTIRKFYIFVREKNWILRHFRMFRYKKMGSIMASQHTKTGAVIHLSIPFCNKNQEKQIQILKDALRAISEHEDIFFPFING